MKEILCPQENSVLCAMRSARWNDELRRHASECADCMEAVQVAGWIGGIAERLGFEGTLPDPTLTWLRSRLEEHLRVEKERVRAAVFRQALLRLGASIVVTLSLYWIWPTARDVVAATVSSSDPLICLPLLGTFATLSVGAVFTFLRVRGTFAR